MEKENKRKRGRPNRYLTVERFEKFLNNDFRHLNWKVDFMLIVLLATFGASIARLFLN